MQERKTNHALLYLACEQIVFGDRLLQRKNCVRQPMKELCMGVKWLLIEGLYVEVRQHQLGARRLPLEDLRVGVRLLQLEDTNQS